MEKNAILLAFANPNHPDKYLSDLMVEYTKINNIFDRDKADVYTTEFISPAQPESIISKLEKHSKNLLIFHFGGHGSGKELQLVDEFGQNRPLFASGFIKFLQDNCQPHLVFLNGCSTWEQALKLIRTGVPHVIATSGGIVDKTAAEFAIAFYREFVNQPDFIHAFDHAQHVIESTKGTFRDQSKRELFWEREDLRKEEPVSGEYLPWKLYRFQDLMKKFAKEKFNGDWQELDLRRGSIEFFAEKPQPTSLSNGKKSTKRVSKGIELDCELSFLDPYSPPRIRKGGTEVWFPLEKMDMGDLSTFRKRINQPKRPTILLIIRFSQNGEKDPDMWWTPLEPDSFRIIDDQGKRWFVIPQGKRFQTDQKKRLERLYGQGPGELISGRLPLVALKRQDILYTNTYHNIKQAARAFYTAWAASPAEHRTHPVLGEVEVSRVGWRNMCRRQKKTENIIQSLLLLGAAKRIIREIEQVAPLKVLECHTQDGVKKTVSLLGLHARVSFPQRANSILQVVLKRCRYQTMDDSSDVERIWFYSVSELNRDNYKKWNNWKE